MLCTPKARALQCAAVFGTSVPRGGRGGKALPRACHDNGLPTSESDMTHPLRFAAALSVFCLAASSLHAGVTLVQDGQAKAGIYVAAGVMAADQNANALKNPQR